VPERGDESLKFVQGEEPTEIVLHGCDRLVDERSKLELHQVASSVFNLSFVLAG